MKNISLNKKDSKNKFNEFNLLNIAGILCGFTILWIANTYFVNSNLYYLIFVFGLLMGALGFVIEYYIKKEKRKAIELEFNYFLYDLAKEYRKTNNLALALSNVSEYHFYGDINEEIKKLANRVSWGDSFENALLSINSDIESSVITHTITLLSVFNKSNLSFDKILINISNDIKVFKSEDRNKKYFSNLFYLSIIFYFVFMFVLLYINFIVGGNFLWNAHNEIITRFFFENFILYIALLLSIFTAYVMYSIKKTKGLDFVKYALLMFIITIILFQIFAPKPDAEKTIIETIKYMEKNNQNTVELSEVIALKTISARLVSEKVDIENIYFTDKDCFVADCIEYIIFVDEPAFFNFTIKKIDKDYLVSYEKI